jgi:hypothetical protein
MHRTIGSTARVAAVAACATLLLSAGAAAGPPEFAESEVVRIVTHDEDGDERTTKIWIVTVDDVAYIRTSGTRWYENLDRDPNAQIRTEAGEHAVHVEVVADPALIERIELAFREKYGFSDRFIGVFQSGERNLMRVVGR